MGGRGRAPGAPVPGPAGAGGGACSATRRRPTPCRPSPRCDRTSIAETDRSVARGVPPLAELDSDSQLRLRTLGGTLRSLRIERGYSLGDVAGGTDLSPSFLSLVENGRSDISTGRLFRLARFYGVGMEELLDTGRAREATVLRAEERTDGGPPADGMRAFPVVEDHDDLVMAPVIYEYAPGARIPRPATVAGTQHFLFVVRGTVEMVLEGEQEPLRLAAGDSAYCGGRPVTEVVNAGDEQALVVWVSSPPAGRPGRG